MNIRPPILALALVWASHAFAQGTPDIGDALRQVPSPQLSAEPAGQLPPRIEVDDKQPPMRVIPGSEPSIVVQQFRIVGNRAFDSPSLLAELSDQVNKAHTLSSLESVAERITRYYRTRGYFVARAYVPAQTPEEGSITLRVVEGAYGNFTLDNSSRVAEPVVEALLGDIKKYETVSLDTLDRAMLNVNDTPGVRVSRVDVMPGSEVGHSDFAFTTEATPAVQGHAVLDNYGSVYTGRARLSGNLDWNSPTRRGDRLSISGLTTSRTDLYSGRVAWSTLVAADGTRVEAALSHTSYELGDRYAALGASGTADSVEIGLSSPLVRTRAHSVFGGVTLAARKLKDEMSSTSTRTPKRAYSVTASLRSSTEHRLLWADGVTQAGAAVTVGRLELHDATARALDDLGAHTQGTYAKLNLNLSRTTQLPGRVLLDLGFRSQSTLHRHNLDGSERMSISGPSGVMAYPIGEASGDHAAVVRGELSHAVGPLDGVARWRASAFADYGWARAATPTAMSGQARKLADAGIALSTELSRGGFARLQIAHRLSDSAPLSESAPRTRVLAQAGWMF